MSIRFLRNLTAAAAAALVTAGCGIGTPTPNLGPVADVEQCADLDGWFTTEVVDRLRSRPCIDESGDRSWQSLMSFGCADTEPLRRVYYNAIGFGVSDGVWVGSPLPDRFQASQLCVTDAVALPVSTTTITVGA